MDDLSYSLLECYEALVRIGKFIGDIVNEKENCMILKVNFKNGSSREFLIDEYYISDNDICLYMRKDGRQVGMINLCEVRYFFVERLGV